jgi:hypothetical protein
MRTYNLTLKHFRETIVAVEKQLNIECVSVALVIQHAKRMPRSMLSFAAWLALSYFSTLSSIFGRKKNMH